MTARAAQSIPGHILFITCVAISVAALGSCTQMQSSELYQQPPPPQRMHVSYKGMYPIGTVVVDPMNHYLYLVEDHGRALRYPVGVGAQGYAWSGTAVVKQKREWPNWYPTEEYIKRRPDVASSIHELEHGNGVVASPNNPLGARALYLWQNGKDTLYRIHGTNEPWTIGHDVSAGCIRLTNSDVIDLYDRVLVGATVVVLPTTDVSAKE
jgi:lipoprotein-anchoring transpeptidase ErfK/SrfK